MPASGTSLLVRASLLQVLAIKRRDTGEWALPGGMVTAGESVSETVMRMVRNFKDPAKERDFVGCATELLLTTSHLLLTHLGCAAG